MVVLPPPAGPYISVMCFLGMPPMPVALSSVRMPVLMTSNFLGMSAILNMVLGQEKRTMEGSDGRSK